MSRVVSAAVLAMLISASTAFASGNQIGGGGFESLDGQQVADSRGWYYDRNGVFHVLTIYGTGFSPVQTPPPANDNKRPRPTLVSGGTPVNSGDRHGPFL